jgi:hypothetical protein
VASTRQGFGLEMGPSCFIASRNPLAFCSVAEPHQEQKFLNIVTRAIRIKRLLSSFLKKAFASSHTAVRRNRRSGAQRVYRVIV